VSIDINLFGVPQIKIGEEIVKISLKKSEAMFYYLLVNKKCSKDEITNLLWGDKNNASAKRNLRVNIHNLKKNFNGFDVIYSEGDFLCLNHEIEIAIDIDRMKDAEVKNIEVYSGEFLESFYLKGAYEFEEWMYRERLKYKELYIKRLYKAIESGKENSNVEYIEGMCKEIIKNDLFDEKAYRILMQHYFDYGQFNKSVELYNSLVQILDKELYISPAKDTRDLFNKIMVSNRYLSNNRIKKGNKLFYGRKKELLFLENQLVLYLENKKTTPILIHGESGIGKSYLIQEFITGLDDKPVFVLQANCYLEEMELFLKPWYEIALRILEMSENGYMDITEYTKNMISYIFPDFRSDENTSISNVVKEEIFYENALMEFVNLISRLISDNKIILIFEDIQWMDKESFRILGNLLKEKKNFFLICTCRNPRHRSVHDFKTLINRYADFHLMKILRFTKEETNEIIELKVEKSRMGMVSCDDVFKESEGNPFFLNHILTNINNQKSETIDLNMIRNTLQFRLPSLSEEARKLIYIISIFYSEVDLKILTRLVNKDELEIFDLIDELKYKDFLSETTILGRIFIKINHNKLREFLYNEQPEWKRLVLHNKVAEFIEKSIEKTQYNYNQYSKLIYHYKNSKNIKKELEYTILYLESIIYLKHEINYGGLFFTESASMGLKNEILLLSKRIKNLLKTIMMTDYSSDIMKSEMIYSHIIGRYYVVSGEYEKFKKSIDEMLGNAEKLNNYEYLIKGYKMMIFHGIEIYNPSIIKKYVDMGLEVLKEHSFPREKYLFTRYLGVYYLMTGNYGEALKSLIESLRLIKAIDRKQPIDYIETARNYYYLGELYRKMSKFNKAISYFEKATVTCVENKLGKGLAQFKAKAGQAAFDKGDLQGAKEYFESSILSYDNYGISWNRPIAEGYLALLYIYENRYTKAIRSLKRADRYCKVYENLYERGIIFRIKAEIRQLMIHNKKLSDIFSDYLDKEFDEYYESSYELFSKIENCYEIDTLQRLKENHD
jgi:DNA-binding SARP family transcriptional activator/tetratricopeptide (TPR) repeat protein